MDYIDKYTFERYVDKAFELGIEERNAIYHKILQIIDVAKCANEGAPAVATEIMLLFSKILEERKNEIEYKVSEKNEGNLTPGTKGVFRRIG